MSGTRIRAVNGNGRTRQRANGNGAPRRPTPRAARDPDKAIIRIRRTENSGPPDDLREGELSAEMDIRRLWMGVPPAVDAAGRIELGPRPAGTDGQLQYNDNGVFGAANIAVSTDGNSLELPAGGNITISGAQIWASMPDPLTVTNNFLVNRSGFPAGSIGTPSYGVAALEGIGAGGEGIAFKLTAFNSLPVFFVRRANGQPSGPTATNFNANLFGFRVAGWHSGGDWSGYAGIQFVASEDHTPSNQGTRIDFRPIRNGTTAVDQTVMSIWSGVKIGSAGFCSNSTNDSGLGWVNVEGGYAQNGVNIAAYYGVGGSSGQLQYNDGSGAFAGTTILTDGNSLALPSGGAITIGGVSATGTRPSDSTALGDGALNIASTGLYNTAIGVNALMSNTTGDRNTAVGLNCLLMNTTGRENVAFGVNTLAGNIANGIGNTAFGSDSLGTLAAGERNLAIGHNAGRTAASGPVSFSANDSVFVGADTKPLDDNQVNQIVIGSSAIGNGSHTITLGNGAITAIHAQVGTITAASDSRLKEEIEPADLDRCLATVKALPVSRWAWRPEAGAHRDQHVTGWLADDVEKLFPKAVTTGPRAALEDCKSITMTDALPTLWAAVQRLSQTIDELKTRRRN